MESFQGKRLLIIGGTGTIGKELVRALINHNPKLIKIYSRDEYKQFKLENSLHYRDSIEFILGDVRDVQRLNQACVNIDYIFYLAAMKHVPACEKNPYEAIKTNVYGTHNIIEASINNGVKKVIFASSDKAINPTNVMGASKLLSERMLLSENNRSSTIFTAVRFGNVLGSRGSVIPLFKNQILEQSKITITHPQMSRFMMTSKQAVSLMIKAALIAAGGEIFVLKMPVVKLQDLAEAVIQGVCAKYKLKDSSVKIEIIGLRTGEKMYEEMMTEEETISSFDLHDMYVVLSNMQNNRYVGKYSRVEIESYSSHAKKFTSKDEIIQILHNESLI